MEYSLAASANGLNALDSQARTNMGTRQAEIAQAESNAETAQVVLAMLETTGLVALDAATQTAIQTKKEALLQKYGADAFKYSSNPSKEAIYWATLSVVGGLSESTLNSILENYHHIFSNSNLAVYLGLPSGASINAGYWEDNQPVLQYWDVVSGIKSKEWSATEINNRVKLIPEFEKLTGFSFDRSDVDQVKTLALLAGTANFQPITGAMKTIEQTKAILETINTYRGSLENLIGQKDPLDTTYGLLNIKALVDWAAQTLVWTKENYQVARLFSSMQLLKAPYLELLKADNVVNDEAGLNALLSDPLSLESFALQVYVAQISDSAIIPMGGYDSEFIKEFIASQPRLDEKIKALCGVTDPTSLEGARTYFGVLSALQDSWEKAGKPNIKGKMSEVLDEMLRLKNSASSEAVSAFFGSSIDTNKPDHLNMLLYFAAYGRGAGGYEVDAIDALKLMDYMAKMKPTVDTFLGVQNPSWDAAFRQKDGTSILYKDVLFYWAYTALMQDKAGQSGLSKAIEAIETMTEAKGTIELMTAKDGVYTTEDLAAVRINPEDPLGYQAQRVLLKGSLKSDVIDRLALELQVHNNLYEVFKKTDANVDITNPKYRSYITALVEDEKAGNIESAVTVSAFMRSAVADGAFVSTLLDNTDLTLDDILSDDSKVVSDRLKLLQKIARTAAAEKGAIDIKVLISDMKSLIGSDVKWGWAGISGSPDLFDEKQRDILMTFALMAQETLPVSGDKVTLDMVKYMCQLMSEEGVQEKFETLMGGRSFTTLNDPDSADFKDYVAEVQSVYKGFFYYPGNITAAVDELQKAIDVKSRLEKLYNLPDGGISFLNTATVEHPSYGTIPLHKLLVLERLDDARGGCDVILHLDTMLAFNDKYDTEVLGGSKFSLEEDRLKTGLAR